MAVLTDNDRFDVWQRFMQELSGKRETIAINKHQLRDAVNALDQYFSDTAVDANNALPAPAKAGLTVSQKAMLAAYVILKRYTSGA